MKKKRVEIPVYNNDTFYQVWEKTIAEAHQLCISGLSESMAADGICDGLTKFADIHRVIHNWYYDTYDVKSQDRSIFITPGLLEQNFIYSVVPGIYMACNYEGYSVD